MPCLVPFPSSLVYPCWISREKQSVSILNESNDEGAKEQKSAILASLKWGGGVFQMFHLFCPRLSLGQNKKAIMEARRGKNAPFWHHWNGGRGGPDVPFILPKIVGLWPNPRWGPWECAHGARNMSRGTAFNIRNLCQIAYVKFWLDLLCLDCFYYL